MKPTPGTLDPEDVRRLHSEGLGVIAIARQLRRRNDLIVTCLQDLGLTDRVTREWMIEQYVTLGRTVDDIAAERGVGEGAIRRYLRRFGIPIRYKTRGKSRNRYTADPDWLREMYVDRGMSMRQVGQLARCSPTSVARMMSKFGITRRVQTGVPHGDATNYERSFLYTVRERILDRDGRRCRWPDCGSTERLEINHIIPVRDRGMTVYGNGITLCRKHHQQTFKREYEFVDLFRELISMGPLT
jgi:transposase